MTNEDVRMLQEVKDRSESNTHQITELKERMAKQEEKSDIIYKMSENLSLMAQSLKSVEEDMAEVKDGQKNLSSKVAKLENQPAQESLETIKKIKIGVITAICTAIGTGLLWICIDALANK